MRSSRFNVLMMCALGFVMSTMIGQTSRPDRSAPTPTDARTRTAHDILDALRALAREARAVRSGEATMRSQSDFAASYPISSPLETVGEKLLRRADRDPFIDAYVRWQLTGYEPVLPALADSTFDRWLDSLPKFAANPHADERLAREMMAIAQEGPLIESDQTILRAKLDDLAEAASEARDMNEPAKRLREWIAKRFDDSLERRLLLAIEHVAALVDAGWSVGDAKGEVEQLAKQAGQDDALSAEARARVLEHAWKLLGVRRLYVAGVRISEGALSVQFDDAAVYDFEIRHWARLIEQERD